MQTTCRQCGAVLPDGLPSCPACGAPAGAGSLVRGGSLDRKLDERLARLSGDGLQWGAALDALARDLEPDLGTPLASSELGASLTRAMDSMPGLDEISGLLDRETSVALDGLVLGQLFDRGGDEERTLRKGLLFLRKRRYDAAVEWFSLHRAQVEAPLRPRFDLLMLLLEAYTELLAGNSERAARLRSEARRHPAYVKLLTR